MGPCSRRSLGSAALLLLLVGLLSGPVQAQENTPASPRARAALAVPLPADRTAWAAQRLLELINRARWEHGRLLPLKSNAALTWAALAHSRDMAQNDYFGHNALDGSSPWDRIDAAGYGNWYTLAENIAAGHKTPEEVLQGWLDSPRHRENLLNPEVNEAGIGYVFQENDTYPAGTWGYHHYWTLDMGVRWDASPLVIAGEAYSTSNRLVTLCFHGQGWAAEMRLSNDGQTWTPWQPYRSITDWELAAGNGLKRVYGQLRDGAGHAMASMDEIWLSEAPSPPPPAQSFQVSPEQAVFVIRQGQAGGQPPFYRVVIADPSGTAYAWHASWDQEWLRLITAPGLSPPGILLILTERAAELPAGLYRATLSIQGEGLRREIPVRLYIFPRLYSAHLPLIQSPP